MSIKSPVEQTKFWRDPTLGNVELLHATYVTHAFSRHMHDEFAIGVIESGIEEFTYQGATHRAAASNIVIVHPGEVHTGQAGVPDGWRYRMFYPEVALLQQAWSELQEGAVTTVPYFPRPVIQDEHLAGQLHRLHVALETSDSRLERESRFLWTLAQLIARYADKRPQIAIIGQEQHALQQVQAYLNTHYSNSISLNQLAAIANLKPLRLLRVFQREMGLPPHAFLIQLRVTRAKALLATGMPIAQVAFDTGFTDQSHLNRHFKRLVGVTPGQYASGCKH